MNILQLLAEDRQLITYRPSLRKICGSVTATILFQQMIYWWQKSNGKPFYKYKAPCSAESYKEGDSWCEELGFSLGEFDTALKQIGIKTKKKELTQSILENADKMVFYWTDTSRKTYYFINEEAVRNMVSSIYVNSESQFTDKSKNPIHVNRESQFSKTANPDLSYTVDYQKTTTKNNSKEEFADFSNQPPQGEKVNDGLFEKPEPEPKSESKWILFVKEFDNFHRDRSSMPLDFPKNGKPNAMTKGLSEVWRKLKLIAEDKHPNATKESIEEEALKAFVFITKNWGKIDPYLQGQFSPNAMASKIAEIIAQIKNGNPRNQNQGRQSAFSILASMEPPF